MSTKLTVFSEWWMVAILVLAVILIFTACKSQYDKSLRGSPHKQANSGKYTKRTFVASNGVLKYNVLFPKGFDPKKNYPLLVFLHGAGERGNDNKSQLKHGGTLIQDKMNEIGGITILPQCPKNDYWIDTIPVGNRTNGIRDFAPDNERFSASLQKVKELIEFFKTQEYTDQNRIYIAGLSMGGMGTLDLCWRMPETFAAAVAICGAGSSVKAVEFKDLPIRFYHGEEDGVVAVEETIEMVEALEAAGGKPEVFLYPEVGHNSWDNAFGESDFISWIFEHKKE